MSFDNVIYEKGEVATLTLNRPDISNGFNIPTCQEILEVLDLVKTDDSVKIFLHVSLVLIPQHYYRLIFLSA